MKQRAETSKSSPKSSGEQPFHLHEAPLHGTNLVEAAAGTGKTYAIECLFVRLIVEAGLSVSQLLVVTYTNAATDQLRDRIRRKLRNAVHALAGGGASDPFIAEFVRRRDGDAVQKGLCLQRLQGAIRDFDQASIFTIHGFCWLMLNDFAFESGASFQTELITDQESLKEEVVRDFWRLSMMDADPLFVAFARVSGWSADSFRKLLNDYLLYPDVEVKPQAGAADPGEVAAAVGRFRAALCRVAADWPAAREAVRQHLRNGSLNARTYGTRSDRIVDVVDAFLRSGGDCFPLIPEVERLSLDSVRAAVRKGCSAPDHPMFGSIQVLCAEARHLTAIFASEMVRLKAEGLRFSASELKRRKAGTNVMYFDDLLVRLRDALSGGQGELLIRSVRGKFRAALVDEFQDTDPVQFSIFRTIFGGPEEILFLIGDPKQAIYGFRGADVFAYLQSVSDVEKCYTLLENRRSDPGLVEAVNRVFAANPRPFVYEGIHFHPAVSGRNDDRREFRVDGRTGAPLCCWFLRSDDFGAAGRAISRTAAREAAAEAVASEIAGLVLLGRQGKARIGDRNLGEGDIAVLVRTNREASLVAEKLAAKRVHGVRRGTANVFDTPEAEEMQILLAAVGMPRADGLAAAALATELLGATAAEIDAWRGDETSWTQRRQRFFHYHEQWRKRGFVFMFRSLLQQEAVRSRLLRLPGGERRLTNLQHLAELLHRASLEEHLDIRGLRRWLAQARRRETTRLREDQLRLESDADAVQILTIHKSKGLEFPVVFCPFLWEGSDVGQGEFLYHDRSEGFRLAMDLGSPDRERHALDAAREALSENCRLLYVALTRAKYRCTFVWGKINQTGTSAPAYLLHGLSVAGADDPVKETGELWKGLTEADLRKDLDSLASEGKFAVSAPPAPKAPLGDDRPRSGRMLRRREFQGPIHPGDRLASYSLLVAEREETEEARDLDPLPATGDGLPRSAVSTEAGGADGIRGFPAGSRTGLFLHDLLRQLDFTCAKRDVLENLAERNLRDYGFDGSWKGVVADTLEKIVSIPFVPDDPSCRLAAVGRRDRLQEVEFHFPMKTITVEKLAEALKIEGAWADVSAAPQTIGRLQFQPTRGYMKGFLDLVFRHGGRYYLVDWKSNFLGMERSDYGRDALKAEMLRSHYYLQCAIYTLALHRYLGTRIPDYHYDRHFGGVYYLFLRGMEPSWGTDSGVYRERPPLAAVERLAALMMKGGDPS
jgi:exodeoxyribonuclease V beta subunit